MTRLLTHPISKTINRRALIFWTALCGSALVPKLSVGSYSLGFEDAVAAICLPLVILWLWSGRYQGTWKLKAMSLAWLLIFAAGFVFGVIHSYVLLGKASIPTELWQYLKRLVYFALAIRLLRSCWITPQQAMGTALVVFAIMNVIGLLQVNSPIAEPLSALYSQNDVQLEALIAADADKSRNYSVTGFSTSWGGLAAFMFYVAIAAVAFGRGKAWIAILSIVCLLNVVLSGSRAALLAVAAVAPLLLLLLVAGPDRIWRRIKLLSVLATVSLVCIYTALTVLADRIAFIQYRNEALVQAYFEGSNRFGDVHTAMSALESPYWWLFGVSNAVQRALYVEWGVEVEPVYLLVNYGLLGLGLRYYLLWLVARRSYALFRETSLPPGARALGAAGLLGLSAYLVFSLGYFFFQESVVGTIPWLLFGAIIGVPPTLAIQPNRNPRAPQSCSSGATTLMSPVAQQ